MENQSNPNPEKSNDPNWNVHHSPAGRILGGLVILAVGGVLLAKQLGVLIPGWVFTWQMIVIAVGLYIGARHRFMGVGWLFPIGIGAAFLIDQYYPAVQMKNYLWPGVIILIGLFMILTSRRKHVWHHYRHNDWRRHEHKWHKHAGKWQGGKWQGRDWETGNEALFHSTGSGSEDYIDSVAVFGSIKKNIISKNFKGGDVVSVFGGTEIDLTQADISGRVILEMTQVFGATRLIVPSHWKIELDEMVAFAGGIEDKRVMQGEPDPNKVLVLKGNTVFGGLEISSFK